MSSTLDKDEQTLATERYEPALSGHYNDLFHALVIRMGNTLPSNRAEIIKTEMARVSEEENQNDVEALRYIAALSVLVDLSLQGWAFDVHGNELTLKMETDNVDDKQRIRYRLSAERNAQFKSESVSAFIKQMETIKNYKGTGISVRNLIGDKNQLLAFIRAGERVCDPYIQLVTNKRDDFTGYKLSDIWRYFRYTWSIPYKTMPGRNLFYLVRDRLQPYHPVIGIFALGNSVLNLTVRDDDIGWTVEAIKKNMAQLSVETTCEQIVSGTDGKKIKTRIHTPIETEEEHLSRSKVYADKMLPLLKRNIEDAISELYLKDLGYHRNTKNPKPEKIAELLAMAEEYAEKSLNNKNNEKSPKWEEEAQSNLFKRKRATELAKLLETKRCFNAVKGNTNAEQLNALLSFEAGRKAIHTALIANRKRKIGSNMMDIIVCGSIPPYNELLGGKLISILACSPQVVRDYTYKYDKQVSEIASRMKGSRVVRDSRLVYLGTTSLYAVGKECLTVLDFIGQANRKYNFEDKFAALLSNTTRSVSREIKDGFISLPKGCYIQLEKKAAKYILDNIRASYGNSAGLVMRIASFEEDTGLKLTLANFLEYYHIDPRQVYKFDTFSRLCARADVIDDFSEPLEETMQKAFARLCTIDSRRLIKFLLNALPNINNTDFSNLTPVEQRMMQMFYISVWLKAADDWNSDEALENLYALADSPILLGELIDLLQYNYDHIDFIDKPVNVGFDCPLDLHCTYTRDQLLVALDFMKPSTVREGVKWLPEKNIDVFFVTLNKADKDYSPTTMYNDYSINSELFHWQSQSTTAADSPTGQRYIHHRQKGSRVLLFVREFKSDRVSGSTAAYTYLGTANYVKHDGEKPMNITWKLDHPIPAKYLKKTNKLVVG